MKQNAQAADRYSRIAILLHWGIALLILANLVVGFFMEGLTGPIRRTVINFHVSSGMTILALTAVRVLWRLTHEPPPYPAGMRGWERHTASIVHVALYVIMVAMPLCGWALVSANPPPGSAGAAALAEARARSEAGSAEARRRPPPGTRLIWGLVPMPPIHAFEQLGATPEGAAGQKVLHDEFVHWHSLGAFLTIGLLLLHVAGALKHQFMDGQSGFARMGVGTGARRGE
jgi:cytochrome b561